jgi:hypothetical protein
MGRERGEKKKEKKQRVGRTDEKVRPQGAMVRGEKWGYDVAMQRVCEHTQPAKGGVLSDSPREGKEGDELSHQPARREVDGGKCAR